MHALTTGARPDGSRISGQVMPLKTIARMDTVELRAVYRFLRTLPPRPYGNR